MLFRFLILVHVCVAFPLKCPEQAQWSLRARGHCHDPSKYFCLKNDLINGYSENCTVFDFLQPGRKNVLRGGLDADICSSERFQPWPIKFYTNASTNCIFLKSLCNEEGQIVYSKGNRNADITCSCDYTRGYDFLVKPRKSCFCVPSEEDCSCYLKTCPKSTDKLSPDYECLHNEENTTVSECKQRVSPAANRSKSENISTIQSISYKVQWNLKMCSICIGLTIAFCIGFLIKECWEAFYFIYEPPSDIQIIEGGTAELMYKLLINKSPTSYLKNNHVFPQVNNIEIVENDLWRILRITNVTPNDAGVYCLMVAGRRSRLTNLIIQPFYFINEPPSDIQLIEGETAELRYKLAINKLRTSFLKNNQFLPEVKNIEKIQDGLWRILKITNTTPHNDGGYCLEVAGHISKKTNLIIQPMFTAKIDTQHCTEGNKIELTCTVYTDSIEVKWFKEKDELRRSKNILITSNGNQRTLTIPKTTIPDSGTYCVKAHNVEMKTSITVKAIFKRPLIDMTNMEGLDTKLECETEDENCHVQWFKDDVEIINPLDRMKIEKTQGRLHTLFISKTSVEDSGKYSIAIKGVKSIAKLDIKEMPETIKLMSVHDREEFLKATKSGITKRHTIRVMIVGENTVGKTCLFRRLMDEKIDDVKSTDGINIERRKCQIDIETGQWHFRTPWQETSDFIEKFADCGFWDFAGQREFYATHQTFLSSNAVYLLVVDISKDFTTNTYDNMIEKEFDSIGEYIDFWLDNIHCYSRDDTNTPGQYIENNLLNPPVIIVGTGIDKLSVEKKNDFEHFLSKILSKHAKRRHIRKTHFVSNTLPSDDKQEFESLRKDIFRYAKDLSTWGDNLPTHWIVLEKEINRKLPEPVISYSDAQNLAVQCSFHNDSQMTLELDSFLKFEHDIGNIIFFEDVKSFIVLDPTWLMDIFRCFVSHQYTNESIGMPEWGELERTGKLSNRLIAKLLEKVRGLRSLDHKNFVLQIMEKFDIIVRPINHYARNDFYMPCMIKAEPFQNILGRWNSEKDRRTSWFCLTFNFLPPSYFNHILVSFVKCKKLLVGKNRRLRIYRNIGEFQLNTSGSQTLVICLSKNAVAMQVRQLNCSENSCFSGVKDVLIDLVNSIKQRYGINITYRIKFKCSEGIYNSGRISLETVMETSEYRCKEHHNTMHSSKEIYSSWLTEEEVYNGSKNKDRRKCNNCENMSVYKCYDCLKVLCKDCSRKHKEKYENHILQFINDRFILNCKFRVDKFVIIDIKCLPEGFVIVAGYNSYGTNSKVITFSVSGEQKDVIELEKYQKRIDVVDKNTIAVFLEHESVAIVDIQQRHVEYKRNIAIRESLSSFIYIENQFYVGDGSGITVIDMSGTETRRIDLSFRPKDMCYDLDSQRIYCTDSDNSALNCIDKDGTIIFTFPSPHWIKLKCLTIDNEGNVLILRVNTKRDCNLGCVIKVDSSGKSDGVVITNIQLSRYPPDESCIGFHHLTNSVIIGVDDTVYIYRKRSKSVTI